MFHVDFVKVELKCAITTYGGQCVMMDGISGMLEWCADNLDYQHYVTISTRLPNLFDYVNGNKLKLPRNFS